ncbi:unnamed protein product [Linum trigynum]|uniref:Transposase MuDR plant domain-containing protein n=1 Tax=Linum trigynum TaxID=586398 RepID=A0AAV2FM34_9ROSI
MAQNPYCLGAEIHAELSEDRGGEEEDDTWSMPSDHDYDDGEEKDDYDDEEEEEEEDDNGEGGEQLNYPPYFYLQGNEEDEELSYADSYGVIRGSIVGGFDGEFYKGQIFHSKQAAQVAIKHYALQRNFQYNVVESSLSIWKIRCLMHKEDKCPWMVRFGCRDVGGDWSVRKAELVHTCSSTTQPTDHRHLDVDVISESVKHLVRAQPNLSVLTVQAELKDKFNMQVTYKKAWYGKQSALEKLHGNWEESYDFCKHSCGWSREKCQHR